jgi:hypothetical protein
MTSDNQNWNALSMHHAKWSDLDGHAKEAAAMIGYTEDNWNPDNWQKGTLVVTPLAKEKTWDTLESPQRDAARVLGLDKVKWDEIHTRLQPTKAI